MHLHLHLHSLLPSLPSIYQLHSRSKPHSTLNSGQEDSSHSRSFSFCVTLRSRKPSVLYLDADLSALSCDIAAKLCSSHFSSLVFVACPSATRSPRVDDQRQASANHQLRDSGHLDFLLLFETIPTTVNLRSSYPDPETNTTFENTPSCGFWNYWRRQPPALLSVARRRPAQQASFTATNQQNTRVLSNRQLNPFWARWHLQLLD